MRQADTNGRVQPLPAMTVTVRIDGGPTMQLRYQPGCTAGVGPGGAGRPYRAPVVPRTAVSIRGQTTAAGWGFADALEVAAGLLVLYWGEEADWPAELRSSCAGREKRDDG